MTLALTIIWLAFVAIRLIFRLIDEDPGVIALFARVLSLLWVPTGLPCAILLNADLRPGGVMMYIVSAWSILGAIFQGGLLLYVVACWLVEAYIGHQVDKEKPDQDELRRLAWFFAKDADLKKWSPRYLKDYESLLGDWREQEKLRRIAALKNKECPPHPWNHPAIIAMNLTDYDYSDEPDFHGLDQRNSSLMHYHEIIMERKREHPDEAVLEKFDAYVLERVGDYTARRAAKAAKTESPMSEEDAAARRIAEQYIRRQRQREEFHRKVMREIEAIRNEEKASQSSTNNRS